MWYLKDSIHYLVTVAPHGVEEKRIHFTRETCSHGHMVCNLGREMEGGRGRERGKEYSHSKATDCREREQSYQRKREGEGKGKTGGKERGYIEEKERERERGGGGGEETRDSLRERGISSQWSPCLGGSS